MGNGDLARIWAYHDGTKHSVTGLRRDPHVLDWENMPRPFKVYPGLAPIVLPRDFVSSTRPALAAIADPGTDAGGPRPVARIESPGRRDHDVPGRPA